MSRLGDPEAGLHSVECPNFITFYFLPTSGRTMIFPSGIFFGAWATHGGAHHIVGWVVKMMCSAWTNQKPMHISGPVAPLMRKSIQNGWGAC